MQVSERLMEHLKKSEGCRLAAYQDAGGVWTIGYGHTRGVKKGDRISQQHAEQLLREDIAEFESYVSTKVRNIRTQGQFDAVVDFCYNVGYGVKGFGGSTLKKYIEAGRKPHEIQKQFMKWTYAGGQELPGLYSRRIWEAARWAE